MEHCNRPTRPGTCRRKTRPPIHCKLSPKIFLSIPPVFTVSTSRADGSVQAGADTDIGPHRTWGHPQDRPTACHHHRLADIRIAEALIPRQTEISDLRDQLLRLPNARRGYRGADKHQIRRLEVAVNDCSRLAHAEQEVSVSTVRT